MNSNARFIHRGLRVLMGTAMLVSLSAMADDAPVLEEARKIGSTVPPKMMQALTEEVARNGVVSAVGMCNEKAPQMARTASEQTGWAIRRVSLRNRNPKAVPDAWERAALEEFDRRAAAGESPATLEKSAMVEEAGRKEFRYMKALPVQQICLACHGVTEKIMPDVAERLHTLYPDDKATGYALGQIRGAMTIRKAQ